MCFNLSTFFWVFLLPLLPCVAITIFSSVSIHQQLFINYKLKSVAHLPWKAMSYKAVNTFIDDLFAFVVPMPPLHRAACLRDDVVFAVFLYQKWIYPVDKTRVNEFGQCFEGSDGASEGSPEGAAQAAKGHDAALPGEKARPHGSGGGAVLAAPALCGSGGAGGSPKSGDDGSDGGSDGDEPALLQRHTPELPTELRRRTKRTKGR
jgi:hypothetical protein